jgi:hypothetical protein
VGTQQHEYRRKADRAYHKFLIGQGGSVRKQIETSTGARVQVRCLSQPPTRVCLGSKTEWRRRRGCVQIPKEDDASEEIVITAYDRASLEAARKQVDAILNERVRPARVPAFRTCTR